MLDLNAVFMDEIHKISGGLSDFAQEMEGIGGRLWGGIKSLKPGEFVKTHPVASTAGLGSLGALALYEHHRRKKAETGQGLV